MPVKEYVIGNKYGMLCVMSDAPYNEPYRRRVNCVCDCGKECAVALGNLKNGHTQSCGCHNSKVRVERSTTHGMTRTKEYKSYQKMMDRCYNPKDISYHNYGAKGIKVCARWRKGFQYFFEDMGFKPTPRMSLDRKKNNRGYCKSNCRWATSKQQNSNRGNNVWVIYKGDKMILSDCIELLGVYPSSVFRRLKKGQKLQDVIEYFIKKKAA